VHVKRHPARGERLWGGSRARPGDSPAGVTAWRSPLFGHQAGASTGAGKRCPHPRGGEPVCVQRCGSRRLTSFRMSERARAHGLATGRAADEGLRWCERRRRVSRLCARSGIAGIGWQGTTHSCYHTVDGTPAKAGVWRRTTLSPLHLGGGSW
jgi:hypothetical protein